MNLLRLSAQCDTEENAIRFLQQSGIIHANRQCGNKHDMILSFGVQNRWRCRLRDCRQEKGLRIGTWLEGSRLPFRKIVLFIYCWCNELTSIKFCERELEIDDNAVIDWNNYLREVCAAHLLANPRIIGGPNTTVEIDESLFSRRKNHVGRVFPQEWVFGGICRETRESFLFTVPDRSAATLMPIITQSILPGTTIISDQWRAYRGLINQGFIHHTVNHSLNFVDPNTGAHTQNVERMWRSAKERNKRHCGTSRAMLDSYMCEYMWRERLHGLNLNPFESIFEHIVNFWPPI